MGKIPFPNLLLKSLVGLGGSLPIKAAVRAAKALRSVVGVREGRADWEGGRSPSGIPEL